MQSLSNKCSQVGDERPLSSCAISPDTTLALIGSWSNEIRLWTVPDAIPPSEESGMQHKFRGLSFPLCSHVLCFVEVVVVHGALTDTRCPLIFSWAHTGHMERVTCVGFHPHSNGEPGALQFASCAAEKDILLWSFDQYVYSVVLLVFHVQSLFFCDPFFPANSRSGSLPCLGSRGTAIACLG